MFPGVRCKRTQQLAVNTYEEIVADNLAVSRGCGWRDLVCAAACQCARTAALMLVSLERKCADKTPRPPGVIDCVAENPVKVIISPKAGEHLIGMPENGHHSPV